MVGDEIDITDNVTDEINKIQGVEPSYGDSTDRKILEIHTIADIEGFEDIDENDEPTGIKLPYIITIDESSTKILSIRSISTTTR